MRALRFLGMGMGVASQGRPACRGFPTAHDPSDSEGTRARRRPRETPPTRTPSSPNSQDLSRYAFASGEGTT